MVRAVRLQLCFFDVLDGVLDGQDLLGSIVRDLAAELLLEGHHQLDGVQAVGAQIIDEAGIVCHLLLVDAKMLDDDLLDALGSIAHRGSSDLLAWLKRLVLGARVRA